MRHLGTVVILLLLGANLIGCAGYDDEFAEEYKEFYVDELLEGGGGGRSAYAVRGILLFKGEPPSKKWVSHDNSKALQPYNPASIRLLLKRGPGRYIIVRSGKQKDYGVSENMDLLVQEFAYLAKMGNGGDFLGRKKFSISNKIFKDTEFFFYNIFKKSVPPKTVRKADRTFFQKRDPGKPIKKDLCVILIYHNEIHFFELYTEVKHYPEDVKDFIEFIESVKSPPPENSVNNNGKKVK